MYPRRCNLSQIFREIELNYLMIFENISTNFKYPNFDDYIMKSHVVRKQKTRGHCQLSIPKEIAQQVEKFDFFKVIFREGQLIFSPIEA